MPLNIVATYMILDQISFKIVEPLSRGKDWMFTLLWSTSVSDHELPALRFKDTP
jgi:hypothetical protein